jgi:hypothetical protein
VGIIGNTTQNCHTSVWQAFELRAVFGSLQGATLQNFSIKSYLGIHKLTGGCILKHVDRVIRVQEDIRFSIGDVISEIVGAIDDTSIFVLNP